MNKFLNFKSFIGQIILIPKANDIPFLSGGTPENQRRQYEYEHRCLMPYYNLNRAPEVDEHCRKTLMSAGFYTFDGAQRKLAIFIFSNLY